ncbi:SNARE associated golgi protein [Clostridium aceticum]|uniref:TVP38/TMEM64 family membrane protein n=1 Tax=Clostridium aceticum TaxID=84022 RepID=A0A0D8IC20_9CLOT|nr:VTT domain-containing protein [Clostridium aceticum]AKL95665.1 SNARE associated golgi protein [Clostridium aceticum]KJF26771.1 hypothetical protein TZ02_11170 [Clostridium aceticum]
MNNTIKIFKAILLILIFSLCLYINRLLPVQSKDDLINFFNELTNYKNIDGIFVGVTVVISILCIPISWMKALGGIYFGVGRGFMYGLLAATISCGISFLIARFLGREVVNHLYNRFFKHKLSPKIRNCLEGRKDLSFTYIFLLRNMYFIPFALTNYLLGVTYISFKKYMLASFLGMIPGTFMYSYFFAKSLRIQENPTELILPIFFVGCYYVLVYILKKVLTQKSKVVCFEKE